MVTEPSHCLPEKTCAPQPISTLVCDTQSPAGKEQREKKKVIVEIMSKEEVMDGNNLWLFQLLILIA